MVVESSDMPSQWASHSGYGDGDGDGSSRVRDGGRQDK